MDVSTSVSVSSTKFVVRITLKSFCVNERVTVSNEEEVSVSV